MDNSNKFIKRFLDFSIGPFFSAIIGFFIVPLTTYFVSPADFGKSSMYSMAYTMFSLFIFLGIDQAFVREFNVEKDRAKLFWNAFLVPLSFSIIIGIVSVILYSPLSILMFDSKELFIIKLLAISLPFAVIDRFNMLVIRMEERAKVYSILNILGKIINVIVLLFYLILIDKSFKSIINATFYSLVITCVIETIINLNYYKTKINYDKNLIVKLFKFGIPLVPASVIGWFLNSMDRISLRYWSNFQQIGLYCAAFKIVMVLGIIQQAFSTFWVPTAYRWHEENVNYNRFEKVSKLLMSSMSIVFVLIVLFKGIVISILSPEYRGASIIIPLLCFYPLMYTVSETTTLGIAFSRKTSYNIIVATISVVINLVGNYMLVPKFGALGASIATGISYIAFFWCRTLISRRLWFKFDIKFYFINTVLLLWLSFADIIFKNIYVNIIGSILIIIYNKELIESTIDFLISRNILKSKLVVNKFKD